MSVCRDVVGLGEAVTRQGATVSMGMRNSCWYEIKRGDSDHFVRLVFNADIAARGYNLSVSTYVEQKDKRGRRTLLFSMLNMKSLQ